MRHPGAPTMPSMFRAHTDPDKLAPATIPASANATSEFWLAAPPQTNSPTTATSAASAVVRRRNTVS